MVLYRTANLARSTNALIKTTMLAAQLARRAARPLASGARRQFAADVAPAAGLMKLNFNLPQQTLYDGTNVKSVIVPGAMGEYEVTADHVPIVAELKAGMLTINHEDGEQEKFFVAGGFSLTHAGSTTVRVSRSA
jgi:hypothetical protein